MWPFFAGVWSGAPSHTQTSLDLAGAFLVYLRAMVREYWEWLRMKNKSISKETEIFSSIWLTKCWVIGQNCFLLNEIVGILDHQHLSKGSINISLIFYIEVVTKERKPLKLILQIGQIQEFLKTAKTCLLVIWWVYWD